MFLWDFVRVCLCERVGVHVPLYSYVILNPSMYENICESVSSLGIYVSEDGCGLDNDTLPPVLR